MYNAYSSLETISIPLGIIRRNEVGYLIRRNVMYPK